MLDHETITQQLDLLATHRRTLAHLMEQAAQYGGEVFAPPQTANGIAEVRAQIGRIKAILREDGVPVEDEPNDLPGMWSESIVDQEALSPEEAEKLLLDYPNATAHIGSLRHDARRERISELEAQLAVARRLRRRDNEGYALGDLGNAYADLGDAHLAINFYEQRLAYAMGYRPSERNALIDLGNAYAALGDAHKAIAYYEQALVIAREIGDRSGEGDALGNLGVAYANLGELGRAIEFYEQSLVIHRGLGYRPGEATGCWNLGLLLEQQGNLLQAVELMQVSVDYLREIGHSDADKQAAHIEQCRQRLAASQGEPHAASQNLPPADAPDEG